MNSSSPQPTQSPDARFNSLEASGSSYAFLVHSAATLPNNLSPTVDDKPLARQRRRRTSPEDQAVLEASYKQNPKPDRAARLELVNRVALGEKEVQIWFQNRRQSSRRKSRPLLPHEIAQYSTSFASSFGSASSYQSDVPGPSEDYAPTVDDGSDMHIGDGQQSTHPFSQSVGTSEMQHVFSKDSEAHIQVSASRGDTPEMEEQATVASDPSIERPQPGLIKSSQESSARLGYLANRRSAPSHRPGQEDIYKSTPDEQLAIEPGLERRLKKTSSYVRLSMSSDGNARVVNEETTPSPPRSQPIWREPLPRHDQGRMMNASQISMTSAVARDAQRSDSGRSRDSRAWEFWCDKDARSELEEKAEQERSGSAADAISLLRSASGRSILGSLPGKRNSLLMRQSSAKRTKGDDHKPSLHRANSSLGRLQGRSGNGVKKPTPKLKYSGSAVSVYIPGNESDKENWSPEAGHSVIDGKPGQERHPLVGKGLATDDKPDRSQREHLRHPSHADAENVNPENDEEVSAFMRPRDRKSNSVSEEEDLDCVQGLLSLSQGNWR